MNARPFEAGVCFPGDDVQEINRRVVGYIRDPVFGEEIARLLGATQEVTQIIRSASQRGLETAVHCRLPLVTFTDFLARAIVDRCDVRALITPSRVRVLLRQFSLYVLASARGLEREYVQAFFGLSPRMVDSLAGAALVRIEEISNGADMVLRLREGGEPRLWSEFLIGSRVDDGRASQIAVESAVLALLRLRRGG